MACTRELLKSEHFTWHLTGRVMYSAAHAASACMLSWTCTFWSAPPLCRIYLQAVPCDPAGADFNFAALSFNSKFLHQIHLIPLHAHQPLTDTETWAPSQCFQGEKMLAWRRKKQLRAGETRAILITTFPLVHPVMCCDLWHSPPSLSLSLTLLSLSLSCSSHTPSLPLFLSLSHPLSLSYWCVVCDVWTEWKTH